MGWSYRKSFRLGPFRVNLSRSGVGYSLGGRGFRVGVDSRGRKYRSISIPGTGLRNVSYGRQSRTQGTGCIVTLLLMVLSVILSTFFG
jgi:hypothetical protein